MKTVSQVCRITGVSVRTLHHYDDLGLLKPSRITEAGYRLYDDRALARLHTILLFRELQFPLKEIKEMLDTPGFDPMEALGQQITLLELRRDHLNVLIAHAKEIKQKGVMNMSFKAFDKSKIKDYTAQAKAKWGKTDAYKEFEEKTKGKSQEDMNATGEDLMDIFAKLGQVRHLSPDAPEVQSLIAELQRFITDHYYNCTNQILKGLGQLYIAGDEMTENIDKAGGPGTAEFAHKAIEIFTK